jgi:predicted aspartyl protease
VGNIRQIYAAFAKHPNQSVENYRHTTIHADISKEGIVLPVSIRGRTVHWLLDTDFNMCAMSESEAKLLGVVTTEKVGQAGDSSSGTVKVRTAVISELSIGPILLHNVAFLVIPDSQPPMDGLSPGRRGLIGFPVAWALRAIGWTKDGQFEIGFASENRTRRESNLFFDGLAAVTRVGFSGRNLDFILDTGNLAGTELWQRFANDFPSLMKLRGIQKKQILTEIGGSQEREATVIPEVQLRIGGFETTLRPAPVFAEPVGDDFHHGLLGMDLLSRAREVRIDFRSMTLQLLP